MSSKRVLLASSLSVCTAATAWAGEYPPAASAAEVPATGTVEPVGVMVAQEAFLHYLNPILAVIGGEGTTQAETGPLTHRVEPGDTMLKIGKMYGVSVDVLARYNKLADAAPLHAGQTLNIPLLRKWIRLKPGDTLERLAAEHRTTKELIQKLNPDLDETDLTYVGQRIAVPEPVNVPKPEPRQVRVPVEKRENVSLIRLARVPAVRAPEQKTPVGDMFLWPITGMITSQFGWRHGRVHKGIDIWNAAKAKAEIHSARAGVVVQAGYSGNYGNLVVIDHGNGWMTYYAHLSRIAVSKGESVAAGQFLGNMGRTGNATGYHLHFEVHRDGKAINPLSVLRN
jgi:murein DD-endopeptidase MepM/ murein hydrolase activator NlpD